MRERNYMPETVPAAFTLEHVLAATALDWLPSLVWLSDTDSNCTHFNRQWLEFTGRDLRSEIAAGWESSVHPEDREACIRTYQEAFARRSSFELEYRLLHRSGEYRWLLDRGEPLYDCEGNFAGYVGCCMEITGRKAAEQALHQRNELLQAIFDHIPVMIGLFDRQGHVTMVNRCWETTLGWSRDELQAGDALALCHPDPGARGEVRRLLESADSVWRSFPPMRTRDGRSIHTIWAYVPLSDDTRVAIGRDISERHRAESLLKASEARFRALIERGSDIIGIVQPDGRLTYTSPSVGRLLGYEETELIGKCGFDFVHKADRTHAQDSVERALSNPGTPVLTEFRLRSKNGEWRHMEAIGTDMRHVPGVDGIVANVRDITERKQSEGELQASHARLRRLAARLESIREQERAKISREMHDELGQILTTLKLEVVTTSNKLKRRLLTKAAVIEQLERMSGMVDSTIATVRRMASELRPGVLDHLGLGPALEWEVRAFRERTGIECGLEVRISTTPTQEQANALFRIFQELLTNVTRHSQARRVCVALREEGRVFVLSVADDGVGISPSRLNASGSLGLLGIRERAGLLGGSVEFRAPAGGGTLVVARIPVESPESEAGEKTLP